MKFHCYLKYVVNKYNTRDILHKISHQTEKHIEDLSAIVNYRLVAVGSNLASVTQQNEKC